MSDEKPTHVFVARKDCGCVVGLVTDTRDKRTGKHVAEFIAAGLAVTREDWRTYRDIISQEDTFMQCPHGQLSLLHAAG